MRIGRTMIAAMFVFWSTVTAATAQDAAYEAWARVFDAIQPGWRTPGETGGVPLIDREDFDIISDYGSGPVRPPNARERAAFERLEAIVPLLADAADHRSFDAGLDWTQGFSILLPHLGLARQSARCMRALSHRAAAEGDAADAALWTGRLAGTAGQMAQDGSLIGSLVGGAIFSLADQELDWLSGSGLLDADAAGEMLGTMSWLADQEDPFGILDAMIMEREIMSMELSRLAEGLESGDVDGIEQFAAIFGDDDLDATGLTPGEVRTQATLMHDLQSRMIDAAADPDRQRGLEAMRGIEAEIEGPDMPALAASLLPALGRVLETRMRLEGMLFDRMRLLEAIARGRIDPADAVNAAILWDRLGTLFETLPGSTQLAGLALVDQAPAPDRVMLLVSRAVGEAADDLRADQASTSHVPASDPETDDELSRWWSGTSSVEATIRDLSTVAAVVTHADFPASPGPVHQYRVVGADLARLRGAGRGLVIDATARLLAAASPESIASDPDQPRPVDPDAERLAAAEEIAAALALVQDLLADPALAHIVLADDLFRAIDCLLRSEQAAPMLADPDRRDRIIDALTAVPRPMLLGATTAARADVGLFADERTRRMNETDAAILRDRTSRLTPDRAYAFLLADSGWAVRPAKPLIGEPPTPITPWEEPAGVVAGYRPLRLIATMEGLHGRDHVLTADRSLEELVDAIIGSVEGADGRRRPNLDGAIELSRYPFEVRAAETLVAIGDLDDHLAEIGRATADSGR